MKLHFIGTRGGIRIRSKKHYRHSSLIITHKKQTIMIDCGEDWLSLLDTINPDAILITHAHPDHVGGLKNGVQCPVYATKTTLHKIRKYPLPLVVNVEPEVPFKIGDLEIQAFAVQHSLIAPAIGYRISAKGKAFFYISDLVSIIHQHKALHGIDLYIGDGAIITRKMLVRRRDSILIGHAPIISQIQWCADEKIPYVIITHCGSEIVRNGKSLEKVRLLGEQYGLVAEVAIDGLVVEL